MFFNLSLIFSFGNLMYLRMASWRGKKSFEDRQNVRLIFSLLRIPRESPRDRFQQAIQATFHSAGHFQAHAASPR